jgi:ankyrin repeat protein
LDGGADVTVVDKEGHTALSFADEGGFTRAADLLKEAGARAA